jgi:hypothetical protein
LSKGQRVELLALRPLLFGTAWTVLDFLLEEALASARETPDLANGNWSVDRKRRRARASVGRPDAIAGLRARVFFLDAAAIDARGTYACSTPEARVSRGLTGIADRVVLLASRRAVRGSALALVAGLEQLDVAVVDEPPSPSLAAAFARAGLTVHVAQA